MVEAYPLQWPRHLHRTEEHKREYALFKVSRSKAISDLLKELERMDARNVVINSNLATYRRGGIDIPYADQRVDDPGVVVYFTRNGNNQAIAVDKWRNIDDNIRAIGLIVQALRGLERWGTKDTVDASFRGFQELPDYTQDRAAIIPQQNYFSDCYDRLEVKEKYKRLVKELHPDHGGDIEQFKEMKMQYEKRMKKPGGE